MGTIGKTTTGRYSSRQRGEPTVIESEQVQPLGCRAERMSRGRWPGENVSVAGHEYCRSIIRRRAERKLTA